MSVMYILVIQRFGVVYHGISHESLVFFRWYNITVLYHVTENTVANTINQCEIRVEHDGKVGCNTVKDATAFLYSDWL